MATYKIVIADPCTVGRENMTDTANGSYCHSCKKEVIDFSNKTNSEIADLIRKNTGGMCGRIYPKQMEQVYNVPVETQYSRGLNKGFIGAALSLLVALFYGKADAKEVKPGVEMSAKIKGENILPDVIDEPVDTNYRVIKGKVINPDSLPLKNVWVSMDLFPGIKTYSKADGTFELKVPKELYTEDRRVLFALLGYEDVQHSIKDIKNLHNLVILDYFRFDNQVDGGMMFIPVEGE